MLDPASDPACINVSFIARLSGFVCKHRLTKFAGQTKNKEMKQKQMVTQFMCNQMLIGGVHQYLGNAKKSYNQVHPKNLIPHFVLLRKFPFLVAL